ncbi:MAG: four-helix bundle copper-binding protein [Nitrospirota bacterium]
MAHPVMNRMDVEMQQCIADCNACHTICTEAVHHCLSTGGRHAEHAHIVLLLDCADMCGLSADSMLRGSEFNTGFCTICAEVCNRCAASCLQFVDDEQMRACGEMCHRCAESCRQMVKMMNM